MQMITDAHLMVADLAVDLSKSSSWHLEHTRPLVSNKLWRKTAMGRRTIILQTALKNCKW